MSQPWSTRAFAASVGGVDPHHHLGDRERADVADGVGLGHLAGDQADDVTAFVEAGVVGSDVGRLLEAGGVLELHVGVTCRHLDGRVHEAEGGGEDDAAAGRGQLVDDALRVGPLGDILDVVGVDPVAELLLKGQQTLVVLVAPALVADRPDVNEAHLRLGLREHGRAG
jgi:hypothetical protein